MLAVELDISYTAALRQLRSRTYSSEPGVVTPTMTRGIVPLFDPGDRPVWSRNHGDGVVSVLPRVERSADGRQHSCVYPHGGLAMIIMAWLYSVAAATGEREIDLGTRPAQFVRELGLPETLGGQPTLPLACQQLRAIIDSEVQIHERSSRDGVEGRSWRRATIVSAYTLTDWQDERDRRDGPWGEVVVTDHVLHEVLEEGVAIDLGVLRRLWRSPRAMDAYLWVAGVLAGPQQHTTLSWERVMHRLAATSTTSVRVHAPAGHTEVRRALGHVASVLPAGTVEVLPDRTVVFQRR